MGAIKLSENGRPTRLSFPSLRALMLSGEIRHNECYALPNEELEKYNWFEEFGGQSFIDGDFTCEISESPCNWFSPDNQVATASWSSTATATAGSSAPTVASPCLANHSERTVVLSDGTKLHPDLLKRLSSRTISSLHSIRGSIDQPAEGTYRLVLGESTNTQNVDYVDLIDTGKVYWAYGSSNWSYHTFIPKVETEFTPSNRRAREGKRGGKWLVEEVRAWPKDAESDSVVSGPRKDSDDSDDSDVDEEEEEEGAGRDKSEPELDPEGEIEIITRYIPRDATLGPTSAFGTTHRPASLRDLSLPSFHIQLDLGSKEDTTNNRIDPNFPVAWV